MKKPSLIWLAVVLFLIAAGLLPSCSKQEKQPGTEQQVDNLINLTLEVDSSKLGDQLEIAGLNLRVPLGWTPVIENVIDMMRKHAEKDTGKLSMIPEFAYSAENGSVLVISRFRRINQPDMKFTDWAMEVGRTYVRVREEKNTNLNWIAVSNIEALQVVTRDTRSVHLKIVANGSKPVSIDFTIPASIWPSQSTTIGSCIGSMKRSNPADS